jgi:FkbM family methyltransferase
MRKIYIDCGTHLGEGLRKHIEDCGIDQEWEIFTFEANRYTYNLFQNTIKEMSENLPVKYRWASWKNINYYNKAVWIEDGEIDFYCSTTTEVSEIRKGMPEFMEMHDRMVKEGDLLIPHQRTDFPVDGSSTILKDHLETTLLSNGNFIQKSLNWSNKTKVESFDFSKWLAENVREEDHVICKIDIEGAEFEVLKKCIKDDTLRLINSLDVEFHHFSNPEYNKDYNIIMGEINRLGIKFRIW